jgi:hypothetical protein
LGDSLRLLPQNQGAKPDIVLLLRAFISQIPLLVAVSSFLPPLDQLNFSEFHNDFNGLGRSP